MSIPQNGADGDAEDVEEQQGKRPFPATVTGRLGGRAASSRRRRGGSHGWVEFQLGEIRFQTGDSVLEGGEVRRDTTGLLHITYCINTNQRVNE